MLSQGYQVFEGSVSSFGSTTENSSYLGAQSIQSNTLESSSYTLSSGYYHFNPTFDDVIHVDDDAIESIGDGSIFRPFKHIQQGVEMARQGQLVLVENGSYDESVEILDTGIILASRFYIDGDSSHIENTIISEIDVFWLGESNNCLIKGFTITGSEGIEIGDGAAAVTIENLICQLDCSDYCIYSDYNDLTLKNISMHNSFIEFGGGNLTINNFIATMDNDCESQLLITYDANVSLNNFHLSGNATNDGDKMVEIDMSNNNVTIQNGIIENYNSAIDISGSTSSINNAIIDNVIIRDSSPDASNALDFDDSNIIVKNSIIRNHTGSNPIVDVHEGVNFQIMNSLIIDNDLDSEGFNTIIEKHLNSKVIVLNSIIYNNDVSSVSSSIQAFYSNIEGASNEYWFGETNIDADPLFENAEDYTLNPASPCIDAGTNFLVVEGDTLIHLSEDDYEGFARDMGISETSQLFEPAANIVSIEDVPADQGGRVYLDFNRSFYDRDGLSRIESYQIDRFDNETWVGVATQNAYNDSTYRVEVTTLIDSSDVSDGMQQYRVIANMDEGNYLSGSAFGYSVDNIAPSVPQNLIGEPQENSMLLNWQPITDEDLGYYLIYRNDAAINGSSVPTFIDSELIYWNELVYTVAAVDINGNESELSNSINAVFSLLGDANLDSMVDVVDVVVTIDALFGYMDLTEQEIEAMDIDESGVINIIDIVMIVEIILNAD